MRLRLSTQTQQLPGTAHIHTDSFTKAESDSECEAEQGGRQEKINEMKVYGNK